MDRLKKIGIIPINKDVLYSQFDELKQPKDKVTRWRGFVIRACSNNPTEIKKL